LNACPKCNSTLPDWAQQCQFCGTPVTPVARTRQDQAPQRSNYAFGIAKWVWVAYFAIAGYFVVSGLASATLSAISIAQFNNEIPEGSPLRAVGIPLFFGLGLAVLGIAVGVGLLFQNDFMKGLGNFYCGIIALFGGWNAMMGIGLWAALSPWSKVYCVWSMFDVVCGLLMLYLIHETNDNSGF
jgi:hypothetical protein